MLLKITRYKNRKYYVETEGRYINLDGIHQHLLSHQENTIQVTEKANGENITDRVIRMIFYRVAEMSYSQERMLSEIKKTAVDISKPNYHSLKWHREMNHILQPLRQKRWILPSEWRNIGSV